MGREGRHLSLHLLSVDAGQLISRQSSLTIQSEAKVLPFVYFCVLNDGS